MSYKSNRNLSPAPDFSNLRSYPTNYQPPTRWKKQGPMDRNEWASFHSRYQGNTANVARVEESDDGLSIRMSAGSVASKRPASDRKHLQKLSRPRRKRSKYIAPPKEVFAYRPRTTGRPAPRPEQGRPTKKPKVPCCFQHEDLEAEFWANMRFPVSRKALSAFPSMKTCKLAKPRKDYSEYCLAEEKIPCRRKMSRRQWRCHLKRLNCLSQPNFRVLAEMERCYPWSGC